MDHELTPELAAAVVQVIREGGCRGIAADLHSIPRATFKEWLRRGKKEADGPYRAFRVALRRAEAELETELIGTVRAAAEKGDKAAAQWLAEHLVPERWGSMVRDIKDLIKRVAELTANAKEQKAEQERRARG
jgi:hypothetical protein